MSNNVQVIDNISGSILFETSVEKLNEAYAFAEMMENEGLDINILAPGLAETLISSLGADAQEIADYKRGLDSEIASHEDDSGCAICPPTQTSNSP
ncbi:MAG: hypothetical protein KBD76_00425 [Bacteriovorax sp.]|nr:hypothetical protein [Bacteriovorax sp.]